MTRRFNIENLERRAMYAAHPFMDYTDDAIHVATGDVNGDGAADVVLLANHSIKSPRDMASGQIAVALVGDFNRDGLDDLAGLFDAVDYNHPDLFRDKYEGVISFTKAGGETVPSDFFANFTEIEFKANGDDLVGWNASGAVNFESQTRPHADGILIGMLLPYMEQDNVYNAGNGLVVDVWEHANLQGGPQTNGIIAVLIGLRQDVTDGTSNTMMLTVDPSDSSGNTFIRVDTTNMRGLTTSLTASEEYFARFANTTFDDAAQVTHDREFEDWANARRFDRGYLPPVGNSILHEDNEYSFPRMIRGV